MHMNITKKNVRNHLEINTKSDEQIRCTGLPGPLRTFIYTHIVIYLLLYKCASILRVALIPALNHVGAQMNNTAITLTMSHFQWKQSHASASSRVLNVLNSARSKPLMCGTMAVQLS